LSIIFHFLPSAAVFIPKPLKTQIKKAACLSGSPLEFLSQTTFYSKFTADPPDLSSRPPPVTNTVTVNLPHNITIKQLSEDIVKNNLQICQ